MLTQFSIDNFRTFKHLNVPKLARVNLISGKNNAGKTALLEAVYLHLAEFDQTAVDFVLRERDEYRSRQVAKYSFTAFRYFYFNHLVNIGSKSLRLQSDLAKQRILIGSEYVERSREKGRLEHNFDTQLFDDMSAELVLENAINSDVGVYFLLESDGQVVRAISPVVSDNNRSYYRQVYRGDRKLSIGGTAPIQFVSSKSDNPSSLEILWGNISLSPLEQYVIEALQIIEPRITDLRFVVVERDERVPLVKLSNQDEPVTLKSMGDGLSRIFEIILRMVNAKNGTLLIDEFENGLHWSVQADIWKVIFTLAETLNIQLFATTHSNDCIACFGKFWQMHPELASFHRLERRTDDNIVAVSYQPDDINNALEMHVEVR